MANPPPHVFNIPASARFLPVLIDALVAGRLVPGLRHDADPLALARATLYLPTQRACRVVRTVFLHTLGGEAAILPRIVALNDVDEDELAFAEAATDELTAAALDLPDALGGLERRLVLAELILKWAERLKPAEPGEAPVVANSPATALTLADDLARLMDDITTRQVTWDQFDGLVPEDMDRYWQITLEFLKIARQQWPAILADRGKIEPAERRDRLIAAEAKRLAADPDAPVIAAGSTGSMPATAALLATIAHLPQGAIVLPGLDTDLDDASWRMIAGGDAAEPMHGHPQFAMQALLARIGIDRAGIVELAPPAAHGRERLVSEALRPAEATEQWHASLTAPGFAAHVETALAGMAVVEAANPEEEALAIAVALREAVTVPDKTAALVTPDRALARRVLAALARWQIAVDDSGGDSLAETPAGVFARLVAEAALGGLAPVTLLALLKHPLCRFDLPAVGTLERAILRGPRPKPGTDGLTSALTRFRAELTALRSGEASPLHRSDPRTGLAERELDAARDLVAQLATALAPLETLRGPSFTFAAIAARHRAAIAALGGETRELGLAFDEIETHGRLQIAPGDYTEIFHTAIADRVVRRPEQDVRVRIFGPLEARLQSVDRMVLGGLVEGTWPPQTRADPWLNRPMRHTLKLDLPERRIGLSAHDFAQALGARDIVITRAARLAGAPTVASRFVQRLAAVAGETRWAAAVTRGETYLAWARQLDAPARSERIARPAPRPPLAARPKQLSVTEIEPWLRDPYTIYAKRILKLAPLDAIDTPPGARDRGTVIHGAIGDFAKAFAARLPADSVAELLALGRQHFAALDDFPEARAFWWPRYLRIATWFAGFETRRREAMQTLHAEIDGYADLALGSDSFRITARADRIEHLADGRFAILDYKTGSPPTEKQVRSGLSPQLTLEAAILRRGGFKGIAAGGSISELIYVALRGGEPPGKDAALAFKDSSPDSEADHALERLTGLAARFAQEATPYRSLVHPMWKNHYGDYDHLARVKEWSLTGGGDDGSSGE